MPMMLVGCKSDMRAEIKALPSDKPKPLFVTYDQVSPFVCVIFFFWGGRGRVEGTEGDEFQSILYTLLRVN